MAPISLGFLLFKHLSRARIAEPNFSKLLGHTFDRCDVPCAERTGIGKDVSPPLYNRASLCAVLQNSHLASLSVNSLVAALLQVGVLIIGAGPTGLGAATRLQQHGLTDWLLIDKASL